MGMMCFCLHGHLDLDEARTIVRLYGALQIHRHGAWYLLASAAIVLYLTFKGEIILCVHFQDAFTLYGQSGWCNLRQARFRLHLPLVVFDVVFPGVTFANGGAWEVLELAVKLHLV